MELQELRYLFSTSVVQEYAPRSYLTTFLALHQQKAQGVLRDTGLHY